MSKNTVAKLLCDAGRVCAAYHDEHVCNLKSKRIQLDEIWSFIYAKQKNVSSPTTAPDGAGDVWTWTAIDADTKMISPYFIGGRDGECAMRFVDDLCTRLANRVQITSDGHKAYLEAIEGAFGCDVDNAQFVKIYGNSPDGSIGRYCPAECTGAKKVPVEGKPDLKHVNASYVER